jgi:hypothetical protein
VKEKIIDAYWWCYRTWKYKICYIHREIYWFFQRGFRGYSDSDVWSFDIYLAGVIGGGLKHLAKNNIGWPCKDEFPTAKSWEKFLNEIGDEFLKYKAEDIDPEYEKYKEWYRKFHEETLAKFIQHFGSYWD